MRPQVLVRVVGLDLGGVDGGVAGGGSGQEQRGERVAGVEVVGGGSGLGQAQGVVGGGR